jgi:cytochrome c556
MKFVIVAVLVVAAQAADGEPPPRRAKPPAWTRDVLDAFFDDAREQLVGERPAAASDRPAAAGDASADAEQPAAAGAASWPQLIDGETLAAEVKRVAGRLGEPLANPAKFKSGGYKQCRAEFGLLAALFGVIAEYDGDVRWKEDAPALRDGAARASRNCKTATDQTFAEATSRRDELEEVVRGQRLGGAAAAAPDHWSELADRPLLMQRMELALQEGVSPKLADARAFERAAPEVRHEAEMLAVLAELIQRENYEYWDDETFQGHAADLRGAAQDLTRAAIEKNYNEARAAAGRASQACSACHEGYRG